MIRVVTRTDTETRPRSRSPATRRDTTTRAMSRAMRKMLEPMLKSMSVNYRRTVGDELRKYGLRYDDLLDEGQDLDVGEALKRLTAEERDMRAQRLKRAIDLSMKHSYLTKEEQAMQTPFDFYLTPIVERVKAERAERTALGGSQPYNRQIP
jgi:ubiquinol-cytochrome c reductase subunit 7